MAFAQRMGDTGVALSGGKRWPGHAEKRQVLLAATQQNLVTETGEHREPQHSGVKLLRAFEIGNLDTNMVKPLQFHA